MITRKFNRFLYTGNALNVRSFIWTYISGFFTGCVLTILFSGLLSCDMIIGLATQPTIFSILFINSFPVIFTICFMFAPLRVLVFPILFFQALFFGFTGISVSFIFGTAGWLVRPVLMFSGIISSVLLWWFLLCKTESVHWKDLAFLFVLLLAVSLSDFFIVSRFLQNLIVYF